MKKLFWNRLREESAGAIIENVVILPFVIIVIYALILLSFTIHDRSTLEAAAKRGVIYASHCICDPNYARILASVGSQSGSLDVSVSAGSNFSFTGIGNNIKPYRYLSKTTSGLAGQVENEILNVVKNTRIPWRSIDVDDITFKQNNKIFYQDLEVTIKASYGLPPFFEVLGLGDYEYEVTAVMSVNDPDEFIRNADLVVDLIAESPVGEAVAAAKRKIETIASKITDFLSLD